ncbi:MAG: 50S ribosomal protein L31 [Planctomycetota bacterium]
MKKDTHPQMYPCKVYYNGEVVMEVGATTPELHVDVWSGSHPFFTGKQGFVDATGRVERFQKRFEGNYFKKGGTSKSRKTRK